MAGEANSKAIFPPWFLASLRFALRDARGGWLKLASFAVLVSLGLGVLFAVQGTIISINGFLRGSAKALLGADLVIAAKDDVAEGILREGIAGKTTEVRLRTMASTAQTSQLIQVRAIDLEYPFYGSIETNPPNVWWRGADNVSPGVVVDPILLVRLNSQIGGDIEILGQHFVIKGVLVSTPGDFLASAVVAPRVYMDRRMLPVEKLRGKEILSDQFRFLRTSDESTTEAVASRLRTSLDPAKFEVSTAEERANKTSAFVASIGSIASIVSLAAILLAMLGTSISMRVYLRSRRRTVAILRCIGARERVITMAYSLQVVTFALFSGALGICLGIILHRALLLVMKHSFGIQLGVGWTSLLCIRLLGLVLLLVGWIAWPEIALLNSARASAALRSDVEKLTSDLARRILHAVAGFALLFLLWLFLGGDKGSGFLLGGLLLLGAMVAIITFLLGKVISRVSGKIESAPLRLGLRNLIRPGNHSISVIISLSVSLAVLIAISLVETSVEGTRILADGTGAANLLVYELNPEQAGEARTIAEKTGALIVQQLPVVIMRIASVKGVLLGDLLKNDSTSPRWPLTREYWTSYRLEAQTNEQLVSGAWFQGRTGNAVTSAGETVPVSIEDRLAKTLDVKVGDEIVWDVQGVPLKSKVMSLRKILWERLERNSFIVFPPGILEGAPQFLFWSIKLQGSSERGKLTREMTQRFPNISVVDLTAVVDEVLKLANMVSRALGALLGLIALIAVTLLLIVSISAKVDRGMEFKLLRRIGMQSKTLRTMVRAEYLTLGVLACIIGVSFGSAIGWAVTHFALEMPIIYPTMTVMCLAFITMVCCYLGGRIVSLNSQKRGA